MNDFMAKKLGEVVAFSNIGLELAERGDRAFIEAVGEKTAIQFREELKTFADVAQQHGTELTTTKAELTTTKLRTMMEQYMADAWNGPTEILEWLSFFTGAGAAHWAVVAGAAQAAKLPDLEAQAIETKDRYHAYLHQTIEKLMAAGNTHGID